MISPHEYKILLVEDDESIREVLSEFLSDEGYQVTTASDGLKAREIFLERQFDLLISDFRMPRMNGVELLNWCREVKIHLPVIFISANANLLPAEIVALSDCCAALLSKPIDIHSLMEAIEEAQKRNHHLDCHHA